MTPHQMPIVSVFTFLVLSALGGGALFLTVSQPDSYPFAFAFGLSWFISTIVCAAYVSCQILFGLGPVATVATWLILICVPFHIYPVILQRWNRGRVLQLHRPKSEVKE